MHSMHFQGCASRKHLAKVIDFESSKTKQHHPEKQKMEGTEKRYSKTGISQV